MGDHLREDLGTPHWTWKPVAPLLLGVLLAAAVTTCGDEEQGPQSLPCLSTDNCRQDESGAGMVCVDDTCQSCESNEQCSGDIAYGFGASCDAGICVSCRGETGCACDAGACGDGLCVNGVCEACPVGEIGCLCRANNSCNAGARCDDDFCEECPSGERGCPCLADSTCDDDLDCVSDVCVEPECDLGTLDCPCGADDACDDGLVCVESGLCAECTDEFVGCPCRDGACSNELTCGDDDTCREPIDCFQITCLDHQLCSEEPGLDAACLSACENGYQWNAVDGSCDPIPLANCQVGAPGSIADDCAAQQRECRETPAGAECGGCVEGTLDDGAGCRSIVVCDDIADDCLLAHRRCTPATHLADALCGMCDPGFREEVGTCVEIPQANCTLGAEASIVEMCAAQNRACVEVGEEPATCGACLDNFVEVDSICRPISAGSCAEWGDVLAQCVAQNRFCVELTDNMATCAGCLTGFDELDGVCTVRTTATCDPTDSTNSIAAACSARYRECVDPAEGPAACDDCLPGLLPEDSSDADSSCRAPLSCLETSCSGDTFCDDSPDGDAICSPLPCAANEAYDSNTSDCVSCIVTCGDGAGNPASGETGRVWSYTLADGLTCVCETQAGYYLDPAASLTTKPCDLDGDGWVRENAGAALESDEPAIADNARCDLLTIDRVVLANELEQRLTVTLCEGGHTSDQRDCDQPIAVALYETERNDDQALVNAASAAQLPSIAYDDVGRRPRAEELNSLTRICAGELADYNHNGIADLAEAHNMPVPGGVTLTDEERVFVDFSYYVELHRGFFEPAVLGHGAWVVAERSRCPDADQPFFLGYSESGDYWTDCTRNRSASYNESVAQPGLDFASWSCAAPEGSCPTPPPPTALRPLDAIPPHGLCDVSTSDDEPFRGMSHHNQFRCVVVADDERFESVSSDELYDAETNPTGRYQFNTCRVACPPEDELCAADCTADGCATSSEAPSSTPGAAHPILDCEQDALPNDGDVGWIATRYRDGPPYSEGCIDEWLEWPELCPSYIANITIGDGQSANFGELTCGCGANYGGAACDAGCPDEHLHTSVDYEVDPRHGLWLCGSNTATFMTEFEPEDGPVFAADSSSGERVILEGAIQTAPVLRAPLCEGGTCTCPETGPCDIGLVIR